MIKKGSQITARLQGKARGCVVLKVNNDRSVLVETHCPKRQEFIVPFGKYQLSSEWNIKPKF